MKIYLDYAATTPVDPRVAEKMSCFLTQEGCFGNPSSNHAFGREAAEAVEHAREQVAKLIHADPDAIIWTSGATEADNLAIKGVAAFNHTRGNHIVVCKTGHEAIIETCKQLEREGFEITYLNPEPSGLINLEAIKNVLRKNTILVALLHVNNETGVIQDIESIGRVLQERRILFHVDAAQSVGKIPLNLAKLPVDLMAFSAHKIYGPKGIGALYVRQKPRVNLIAQSHGGGQQQGLRSGTLPTHQIVGMGEAFEIAEKQMQSDNEKIKELSEILRQGLQALSDVYLNGDIQHKIPHILNVSFADIDASQLLPALKEIAVSTGSACHASTAKHSAVLRAMNVREDLLAGAIRFSLGRFTTKIEIEEVLKKVSAAVNILRGR